MEIVSRASNITATLRKLDAFGTFTSEKKFAVHAELSDNKGKKIIRITINIK